MMEASGITAVSAMQRVRDRTARFISVTINDTDALMIALTCATMEHGELLELSHDRIISVEASKNAEKLKLPSEEFGALFCNRSAPISLPNRRDLASIQAAAQCLQIQDDLPEAKLLHLGISNALSTTFTESVQADAWKAPRVRRLSSLALMRQNEEESLACLGLVVGEVVGSDLRRWEDLREDLLVNGVDLMLVSETIASVARSI